MKHDNKDASPKPTQAQQRIEAIEAEIARALIQRNTLPQWASDEEQAAAAARVEQLHAQHHEAVQQALAIKRDETTKLEREHKEKKLRHKRLRASRLPGGHTAPYEDSAAPQRHTSVGPPMDRVAEEAQMDAANEEDMLLERQKLQEEDRQNAGELVYQRDRAEKKRKTVAAAKRREAKKRHETEAEAKAETAQLEAEKEERAKIRQQAALQRAEAAKAAKHQQRAERQARQRAAQDARSSGWFSEVLRQLKTFFRGRR